MFFDVLGLMSLGNEWSHGELFWDSFSRTAIRSGRFLGFGGLVICVDSFGLGSVVHTRGRDFLCRSSFFGAAKGCECEFWSIN